jgi:hypothetical protein
MLTIERRRRRHLVALNPVLFVRIALISNFISAGSGRSSLNSRLDLLEAHIRPTCEVVLTETRANFKHTLIRNPA